MAGLTEPTDGVTYATAVAARMLIVDRWTAEVVRALDTRGIDAIVLKGPTIAAALYAGAPRLYEDIDLLVDPERHAEARELLGLLGYGPVSTPVIDARLERHAEPWGRPTDGALVDLHHTLPWVGVDPPTGWTVFRGEAAPLHVGGADVLGLNPPALAVHVALHAVFHGSVVEGPLDDLQLAVERWDVDVWSDARRIAEQLGALPGFRAGLEMVPRGRTLAAELDLPQSLPPEVALASSGPRGAVEFERLAAHPRRDWVRIIARQLVPPREFMDGWRRQYRPTRRSLFLAYLDRLGLVLARGGPALFAYIRARRTSRRSE